MSVYPFCAQCKRKTPEKTAIFNSYCDCCKETLCIDCSENHTSVKGFSSHKLIDSVILLSPSTESYCYCNVHLDKILIWYCPSYDVYLCDQCESKSLCDGATCNRHICFNKNLNYIVLAGIKSHFEGEMSKMKNILDICYKSRITIEEEISNRISGEFSSETTSENDEKDRKVFAECLEQSKLERKGIEILHHYQGRCEDELKIFLKICTAAKMLSLIMNISNLKQDILKMYSSLKKRRIPSKDRLKQNVPSICEAGTLVIKSFQIESKLCLREENVRKVILIENKIIVAFDDKIHCFSSRSFPAKEIPMACTDIVYIPKLEIVAILTDYQSGFSLHFLNVGTYDLKLNMLQQLKTNFQQRIHAIAASSEYIYFAGQNCTGRIALNGQIAYSSFDVEVDNTMVINNNEIIIPFGQSIRIYSLIFELLRVLTLSGEFVFEAQQPLSENTNYQGILQHPPGTYLPWNNQQTFINRISSPFNSSQSPISANFISITTDQDNNIYAVNTNSHVITRWDHLNKKWDDILTPCHDLRHPFSLNFDEEFSNAYVCEKDCHSSKKYLMIYKVIWDTIGVLKAIYHSYFDSQTACKKVIYN